MKTKTHIDARTLPGAPEPHIDGSCLRKFHYSLCPGGKVSLSVGRDGNGGEESPGNFSRALLGRSVEYNIPRDLMDMVAKHAGMSPIAWPAEKPPAPPAPTTQRAVRPNMTYQQWVAANIQAVTQPAPRNFWGDLPT